MEEDWQGDHALPRIMCERREIFSSSMCFQSWGMDSQVGKTQGPPEERPIPKVGKTRGLLHFTQTKTTGENVQGPHKAHDWWSL